MASSLFVPEEPLVSVKYIILHTKTTETHFSKPSPYPNSVLHKIIMSQLAKKSFISIHLMSVACKEWNRDPPHLVPA